MLREREEKSWRKRCIGALGEGILDKIRFECHGCMLLINMRMCSGKWEV